MAIAAKFNYTFKPGAFAKAMESDYQAMARAAMTAMKQAADIAKRDGRASIRAAGGGFVKRWPNALRSRVYPSRGISAHPAATISVASRYAGIFDDGGTILGKPLLWLPLSTAPKTVGGKKIRPGLLRNLVTIRRPGKPPLLGARIRATDARFGRALTVSQINRGTGGKRGRIRVVPLFVGIPRVTIAKKWKVREAVQNAAAQLPRLYRNAFRS